MKLLLIGDVMGRPGRKAVQRFVPGLREELGIDVVIANGENLAGGAGLTRDTAQEMFDAGIDLLSGGNHTFDKREAHGYIEKESRVLRPANYPPGTPGNTLGLTHAPGGLLALFCVLGRVFMKPLDDPFRSVDVLLKRAQEEGAKYIVVDVHAEASSEKMAMGWYLDGKVSAVVGTHTHVPTADLRILDNGSAYVTDLGMTGPYDSVIGMEKEPVLAHFRTGLHHRFRPAHGDVRLWAVVVELDEATGLATRVERIERRLEEES